jgi:hypothetical protein
VRGEAGFDLKKQAYMHVGVIERQEGPYQQDSTASDESGKRILAKL